MLGGGYCDSWRRAECAVESQGEEGAKDTRLVTRVILLVLFELRVKKVTRFCFIPVRIASKVSIALYRYLNLGKAPF